MMADTLKTWKRRALRAEKELEMLRAQRDHAAQYERMAIARHVSHAIAIDEIREALKNMDNKEQ